MTDSIPCAPIGVFDSGLGGLTVLAALRRAMPEQDFLYLGDNANAPYGMRSPDEVMALTRAAVERLFARECALVLIACNTASALALRRLQRDWLPDAAPDRRILGVFVPLIEAVSGHGWREAGQSDRALNVAFFATPATVASGAFSREARRLAPGLRVTEQGCPGLVEALEAGSDPVSVVRRAVAEALTLGPPDVALLGCTHYPLAAAAFRAALPPGTPILSQPDIVARSLAAYLDRHPRFAGGTGRLDCLTTGDPVRVGARAGALSGEATGYGFCAA